MNGKTALVTINKEVISCGFADNDFTAAADGKFIPLLPGWGNHQYTVSTSSDSAQIYFNQGLSFYFSYHFREARASFKEAARFDENCAMAWWGLALAMGPYYNNPYYKMGKEVPAVMQSMHKNTGACTQKEQALIQAMQQRYSGDTGNADRPRLDSAYAAAMKVLVHRYPTDDDIKALYIDAVMLQHKWDFWNANGVAKPWTMELVSTCESILKRQPKHPAALHYYIHLTEASRQPGLALHSADVLKDAMPGVGHMVHMATHMYQRNGLYAKGVAVNEDANTVNNKVDDLAPNLGIGKDRIVHVYDVQSFCAINAGMYSKVLPLYERAKNRMLALSGDIREDAHNQQIFMLPVIAMVRTGNWASIISSPAPDNNWKYATVLDDFAKGLAMIRIKNLTEAGNHLAHLERVMQDSLLTVAVVQDCRSHTKR